MPDTRRHAVCTSARPSSGSVCDALSVRPMPQVLAMTVLVPLVGSMLLTGCAGRAPGSGAHAASTPPPAPMPCQAQSDDGLFLTCLRTDLDEVWGDEFRTTGRAYTSPALTVELPATPTGDRAPDSTRDRAYFSARSGIHFPTEYLDDVRTAHGPLAHVVLTFTLAHETGHHVQLLLHRRFEAPDVDVETQADCYAGFWARREADASHLDLARFRAGAQAELRRLSEDPGEVRTHGSADQRIASLAKGLSATDPAACDVGSLTWR